MDMRQIYLIDKKSKIYCLDNNKGDELEAKKPRSNEYLGMRGTHFAGYLDERLLPHVLDS
jgi:hypothetical protein